MSCTTCGSNIPCGCAGVRDVLSVGGCGANTCCQNTLPGTPTPFYQGCSACPEDHREVITVQRFYASIKISDRWNVPACNSFASLIVNGLASIVVGGYIWNPTYGFFQVTAFNANTQQITVLNTCADGNAAPGTAVPACTDFMLSAPPCDCGSPDLVCVAIDFTAPDVDDCIDITLTSTQGLTVSDTVQIGTGFYFLQAVKPNDIITICNHGEGITPGTSVIAKDGSGNYQYCLSVVSTNPCDRTAEDEVVVLGCGTDGVTVPLHNLAAGWVLTQLRENDNSGAWRPLGADYEDCTTLTADLVTANGVANYANVAVADSSVFTIGDVLNVAGGAAYRFTVTGIPDGTHINITIVSTPGGVITWPSGSVLCLQSCCETLETEVTALGDMPFDGGTDQLFNDTPFTVGPVDNDFHNTAPLAFTITNPSATRFMRIHLILKLSVSGTVGAALGDLSTTRFALNYTINGGGPVEGGHVTTTVALESDGGVSLENDQEVVAHYYINLATNETVSFYGTVQKLSTGAAGAGENDGVYTASSTLLSYSWIGVPGPTI